MRVPAVLTFIAVASVMAISGCADAPDSSRPISTSTLKADPTPTPQVSHGLETHAGTVNAAIETYEAYVSASDDLVIAERATWDAVLDLLADPYLSGSLATYDEFAASGYRFEGEARIVSAVPTKIQQTIVNLHVCTDFSETRMLDSAGNPIGTADDYVIKSMNVILQADDEALLGWKIVHFGYSDLIC